MNALRLALIASLLSACSMMPEQRPQYPQAVGPPLGESTAMGPADSSRSNVAKNLSPSGVPLNVGPGRAITPPAAAPAPTEAPAAVAEEVVVLPVQQTPPPPVFTPPPPPAAPDLSDRVMADESYE
jgi:hypothetical protein